jgi:hypothetical protein
MNGRSNWNKRRVAERISEAELETTLSVIRRARERFERDQRLEETSLWEALYRAENELSWSIVSRYSFDELLREPATLLKQHHHQHRQRWRTLSVSEDERRLTRLKAVTCVRLRLSGSRNPFPFLGLQRPSYVQLRRDLDRPTGDELNASSYMRLFGDNGGQSVASSANGRSPVAPPGESNGESSSNHDAAAAADGDTFRPATGPLSDKPACDDKTLQTAEVAEVQDDEKQGDNGRQYLLESGELKSADGSLPVLPQLMQSPAPQQIGNDLPTVSTKSSAHLHRRRKSRNAEDSAVAEADNQPQRDGSGSSSRSSSTELHGEMSPPTGLLPPVDVIQPRDQASTTVTTDVDGRRWRTKRHGRRNSPPPSGTSSSNDNNSQLRLPRIVERLTSG